MSIPYLVVKRIIDFFLSVIAILLFSPFLFLIAVWIKLDSPGPILFRQERVGKLGKPFLINKFRTMIVDAERLGKQLTVGRDPRITRCGTFLRKYKLDELPQLFNIIQGEMSIVGPRPEVPRYVGLYNDQQKQVLSVRPGLTDEASIKYRNENQLLEDAENAEQAYIEKIMPDKLEINQRYIQTLSFKKDFQIVVRTIIAIMERDQHTSKTKG